MLSDKEIKKYSILSGKTTKEVKKILNKAENEAKSLGKEKDKKFIIRFLKDLLDLDESKTIQLLTMKFSESEYNNFDDFIEALISSDILPELRPEMHIKKDEEEIDEEYLKNKDNKDEVLDNDKKENDPLYDSTCDKKKK